MFHKTSYMRGFHVEAADGGIGHVDDFLVDQAWNVRYLVVRTSNWPAVGDSVLVPPAAVEKVDPPQKEDLCETHTCRNHGLCIGGYG